MKRKKAVVKRTFPVEKVREPKFEPIPAPIADAETYRGEVLDPSSDYTRTTKYPDTFYPIENNNN